MSKQNLLTTLLAAVLGAAIALGAQALMKPSGTEGTTDVSDEFGTNVREYLLANPNVVIEALQKHQQQEQQAQLDAAKQVVQAESQRIFTQPSSPIVGNQNGNVSMVEFFDYNCGYCRRAAPDVEKLIADDPNLRVIHKQLPILGPESLEATKVALAARMQDPAIYPKIHHAFMTHEGKLDAAAIEKIAREAGANWEKVLVDKESDTIKDEIKTNYELAQKLGLTGTPGFIVGSQFLPGAQPFEALKSAIDAERQQQSAAQSPDAAAAPAEPTAAAPTAEAPATPEATAPEATAPQAATPEAQPEAAPAH